MRRILVLSESLPYPVLKGGDRRTWQNVNALASWARVGVFGLCSNDRRQNVAPPVPLECWAASTDEALASPPPKGVRLSARAWLFDPAGHPSDLLFSAAAAQELSRMLANFQPDVVLIEGLWLHGYIDVVRAAGCRIILDCHNVESAVLHEISRTREGQDLEARVVREVLPARTAAVERRAIGKVDQVWVCSREDQDRIRGLCRAAPSIGVVPNGLRLEDYDAEFAGHHPRPEGTPLTLVFPAFYSYLPNRIAAAFLVHEIFPRLVSACPDCRLLLVGAAPPADLIAAAAHEPRVSVTGAVPDIRPYLAQATAMAVPIFQGGGTRLKVLEGFAAGVPVVSTKKGAEGLGTIHGTHLLRAETAEEFVDAAVAIWRDPTLAERLTANARALVAERFSWTTIGVSIRRALAELLSDE